MFLVVLGILSLVLALTGPIYPWVRQPWTVGLVVGIATILPAIVGVFVMRRTLRLLDRHAEDPGLGQGHFNRNASLCQFLLGALHSALLLCTHWMVFCRRTPLIGDWPAVGGLLAVTPFLIGAVLLWLALFPADRAVRQIAVEVFLDRSRPVQPAWSLGQYLAFNLRHQILFILIPMALILLVRDVVARNERSLNMLGISAHLPDLLLGLAAGLVAVLAPLMLRYIWLTQSLGAGPLRDKLTALSRRLRVGYRDILVWHSGGMMVNAAVMGIFAPLRYVLLTDAMLSQMDDTKIEAVFGHEIGHVKRHHILYFLLFSLISGCILTVFTIHTRGLDHLAYQLAATALGLLLAFKWGVLFLWISRKFERQADLFGVRTLELAGVPCQLPCALHGSPGEVRSNPPPGAVCATAANLFGDTLNEVAVLNGMAPEANSLRHGSISSRSRFVQGLAADPAATLRFEKAVGWVKTAILVLAIASSLWALHELQLWETLQRLLAKLQANVIAG